MGFAPPVSSSSLTASAPLALAALGGTATVRLSFSELFLADEDVVLRQAYADWAVADAQMVVNAQPAAFGLARAAISVLRASGDGEARRVAEALAAAVGDVRAAALDLVTGAAPGEALAGTTRPSRPGGGADGRCGTRDGRGRWWPVLGPGPAGATAGARGDVPAGAGPDRGRPGRPARGGADPSAGRRG